MSDLTKFETLNRASYEAFQKKLLPKTAEIFTDVQFEFLNSLDEGGETFCQLFLDLGVEEGEELPVPPHKLNVADALEVPWSTEEELFSTWRKLTPCQAALPEFWARATIELIRSDKIEHLYLAKKANGVDGRTRIRQILKQAPNKTKREEIRSLISDVLRRIGGIYTRGKRTSYIDCPLAKSWWRYYYASDVIRRTQYESNEEISEVLRRNKSLWEQLIQAMVSRLTVVSASSIRNAVIQHYADVAEQGKIDAKLLLNEIGLIAGTRSLPALSIQHVLTLIREDINPRLTDS